MHHGGIASAVKILILKIAEVDPQCGDSSVSFQNRYEKKGGADPP